MVIPTEDGHRSRLDVAEFAARARGCGADPAAFARFVALPPTAEVPARGVPSPG